MRANLLVVVVAVACAAAQSKPAPRPAAAAQSAPEAKPAAPEPVHDHAAAAPDEAPPLFDDLGEWRHPVRASVAAQRYFDQGLRLAYAFNHEEALRSFQHAAALDPRCAMCFWGAALVLGPNINLPTDPQREKLAWDLVARARAAAPEGAEREYVEALAKRYANPPGANRRALDEAYASAMRELAQAHPDDVDAAVLFAEAMMDLRPWDLWTKDGKPQPGTGEILATLRGALAVAPAHPGANHFYIHATEASPHPEAALASAQRLPDLMPGAGHIVHMPAHTFIRTGQYESAAEANRRAIAVDRRYLARTNAQGIYAMMYTTHNFQFLWAAASLEGRSAEALQAAREVATRAPEPMVREMEAQMPGIDFMLAPPLFTLVRFGRWDEVLAAPAPPADFKCLTAAWHSARGVAFAATHRPVEARAEHAALAAALAATPPDLMLGPLNSARAVLTVAERQLAGEIEARTGDRAKALSLLREAVAAEDALGYDEPPPWPQPARLALATVLLEANQPKEAERVFREDLERTPENGWALFGLAQALRAQHAPEAAAAQARFEKAWSKADVKLTHARY